MNYEFSREEIELPNEGFPFMAKLVEKQLDEIEKLSVEYANDPRTKNAGKLSEATELNIQSVRKTLDALRDEFSTDQEAVDALFHYVLGLERRRVEFLGSLDDDDTDDIYVVTNIDDFAHLREAIEQSHVTAVESAASLYQNSIAADISIFSERSIKDHKNKPSTIRNERVKTVGKHALDITKVGLGVISGLLIAKKTKLI